MKPDAEKLRAYLDNTLSATEQAAINAELAHSPSARAELVKLQRRRDRVAERMATLSPSMAERPDASRVWQNLQTTLNRQLSQSTPLYLYERTGQMTRNSIFKHHQTATVTVALAVIFAVLFSFAPVRAAAGNFLQVFRVQKVKIVPVDMTQLKNMESNTELNALLEQFDPEASIITGGGEPEKLASLAEAGTAVNFPVATLPSMGEPDQIFFHPETVVNLKLDKDLLLAVFDSAKIDVSLPDSLNNAPIVITKPDTLIEEWGSRQEHPLTFIQLHAPEIEYPDDLDLNALGAAGLQLLGMSKVEATTLSATIDWANTLVLPVPTDAGITATEVSVNGNQGFIFSDSDGGGSESALLWQANGMTYFLEGRFGAEKLLALAASVQ